MKLKYKYFVLENPYQGRYNLMSNKKDPVTKKPEFLGSIETKEPFDTKGRNPYIFIPEQPENREIIWFKDCLEDVISILGELNK